MFKAAILAEINKPLKLVNLFHIDPSEYQVKIKMLTSGLCGAQVNEISGKKGFDKYLPHLMGHEGYGIVVSVGKGVSKVKTGDHVILHWRPSMGFDSAPIKYESDDGCLYGAGPITTFSEFSIVSENRCTKINAPKLELMNIYPLVGCALSTSWGAIKKESVFDPRKRILIFGAGGLGLSLLFWTNLFHTDHQVYVVDIHESKAKLVKALNGQFITSKNLTLELGKFDLIFETTGAPESINSALEYANKQSEICLIGQTAINQPVTFSNFSNIYEGIKMFSSQGGCFDPDQDIQKVLNDVEKNKALASTLVSHIISLDEVNYGFNIMKDPEAGRVIINFNNA